MRYTVWVKCGAVGCYSRWYIYIPLCFTGARECSTKYTSAYLTLNLLRCDAVLFGRGVQPFVETRRFYLLSWRWRHLVPAKWCCMCTRIPCITSQTTLKTLRPENSRSRFIITSSPRKRCLFCVTWMVIFLNQRLYHSRWRRLMLSRRHLRVGRQTFTIFSVSLGSQQRGSYEGQCKSGNRAEALLIRQRLSVCVRTDVCEWKQFVLNKWRTARHLQQFFFSFPICIYFCQS